MKNNKYYNSNMKKNQKNKKNKKTNKTLYKSKIQTKFLTIKIFYKMKNKVHKKKT